MKWLTPRRVDKASSTGSGCAKPEASAPNLRPPKLNKNDNSRVEYLFVFFEHMVPKIVIFKLRIKGHLLAHVYGTSPFCRNDGSFVVGVVPG